MKYKFLSDLKEAIENGEILEENILIRIDSDVTDIFDTEMDQRLYEGDGYLDVYELYKIIFRKAKIEKA